MINETRINKIISEEINRFILKETINFNNLSNDAATLNNSLNQMSKFDSSRYNQEVNNFLYGLEYYSIQIINAIKRCVNSQNINEINVSDFGIHVPQELGGNLWQNMQHSYYKTKNALYGIMNNKRYSTQNKRNNNNGKQTNVKSEKLLVLLGKLTQYQNTYQTLVTKYSLNQGAFTPEPQRILFQIIPSIAQNAQGNNP